MENTDKEVLELCRGATKENPISVWAIGRTLKTTSACVRTIIARLREQGHRICSMGDGYWVAKTDEEYLEFRKHYMSKINKRLRRLKAMDLRHPMQIELEV